MKFLTRIPHRHYFLFLPLLFAAEFFSGRRSP